MDRLDELAVLVAIIDTGSLAAAARRLNRSAPAITRVLASLEGRTGERLLVRNSRRMEPTPRGAALAEEARHLLALYGTLTGAIPAGRNIRRLRITAPVLFGRRHVAPILARLLDEEPDLQCEFMMQDRVLDLVDERIDIAIRIGSANERELPATRLGSLKGVMVAAPGYLNAHGIPQAPRDLAAHQVVLGLRGGYVSQLRFSEAGRRLLPRLRGRLAVDDIATRLRFVLDGGGLGQFLSYQVFDELRDGRLVRVLADYEPPALPVHLLRRRTLRDDPLVQRVIDRLTAGLRENPVLTEHDRAD
ncbi:LysR family transcriptional regulator [Rhizobiaceae bacterium BDR2-2]|uniref:LysR family transcriptional regulator n=1 Tax=Ectorhizobium quercum TaxID=2965071 RepID=A0AAE3SXJ6_9HYPH|nr:LysR family transcriptional regulator [Ectorhizobium quercum]MCX8999848.1 LysR family transcriptional regulator [Ectorhizobium quercum]